jgi:hypothetical protein
VIQQARVALQLCARREFLLAPAVFQAEPVVLVFASSRYTWMTPFTTSKNFAGAGAPSAVLEA